MVPVGPRSQPDGEEEMMLATGGSSPQVNPAGLPSGSFGFGPTTRCFPAKNPAGSPSGSFGFGPKGISNTNLWVGDCLRLLPKAKAASLFDN